MWKHCLKSNLDVTAQGCMGRCILLFKADPLQHQLPRQQMETHYSTERVAFIVKKAGSDILTSCTMINPPLPRLMGHKKQNQTQTPAHHGVTQVQLSTAVPDPTPLCCPHVTPGTRAAAVKGSGQVLTASTTWRSSKHTTEATLFCTTTKSCAFLKFYFICKVNKNPLLGTQQRRMLHLKKKKKMQKANRNKTNLVALQLHEESGEGWPYHILPSELARETDAESTSPGQLSL